MLKLCFVSWISAMVAVLNAGTVCGQTTSTGSGQPYPNKPIRIVTGSVGGGSDFMARLIAQGITGPLGQPVIVDNRPTGAIPAEVVSKAPPEGYTLLVSGSNFWIGPLFQNAPYDPVKDFSPITLIATSPLLLVVHPSLPITSVKELIAYAKAKPGQLNYSSGPTGGPGHLAPELFKAMAGVNIVRITYKGGALVINALLAGEVQVHFAATVAGMPHVKSGKFRALAVTSAQPTALAPGLPTVAASGVPGYEVVASDGIFAPAGTPASVVNRLNQEIVRLLNTVEIKERIFNTGAETVGNSPQQMAAAMKAEITKIAKLIKDAGIKAE